MSARLAGWFSIGALALAAYLVSLDGLYIPSTGDEAVYTQITRLTAASGHWLPLQPAEGLGVTKPPLLFWHGLIATDWGREWSLWRLRLPIVGYSFLAALLVFALARRISGSTETGALGAVTFLGFTAVFHHGRPFLTNLPEVLFLCLAFFLFLWHDARAPRRGYGFWILLGALVGLGAWARSIVLLAPVGLALAWIGLWRRRWRIGDFLRDDALPLALLAATAIAVFALWLALDPDPGAIVREFLLGENFGKLSRDGSYWQGLVSGSYPLTRVWLGTFLNAGFFALPLAVLAASSLWRRRLLGPEEKALWIWVLAFVLVFSIPAQRQASYVLATLPALAVLLALRWHEIPRLGFMLFLAPLLLVQAVIVAFMVLTGEVLPAGAYTVWNHALAWGGLALGALALVWNRAAPRLFHALVFVCFISFAQLVAPFEGPLGRYGADAITAARGRIVYAPSNFRAAEEPYRFILPGADIRPYVRDDAAAIERLLAAGETVIVDFPYASAEFGAARALGTRLAVRLRIPDHELRQVLFERRLDLLVRREVILHRPQAILHRPQAILHRP